LQSNIVLRKINHGTGTFFQVFYKSLFKAFSWSPLSRLGLGCKAHTAAGLVARRGFATPQTGFKRGNPSGMAANRHARRCPLAQAASMGCGGRLDRGGLLPCGLHEKASNRL
jgi:hypothetical protein